MKQNRNSDKKRHHEETIHDRQYRSMVKRYKWKNHAIIAGALLGFSVLILFIIVSDIPLTAANGRIEKEVGRCCFRIER